MRDLLVQPPSLAHTNGWTVPPLGVAIMAGCGADLLINILLTIWLYVLSGTSVSNERAGLANQNQLGTRCDPRILLALHLLRPPRQVQDWRAPGYSSPVRLQRQGAVGRNGVRAAVDGCLFRGRFQVLESMGEGWVCKFCWPLKLVDGASLESQNRSILQVRLL